MLGRDDDEEEAEDEQKENVEEMQHEGAEEEQEDSIIMRRRRRTAILVHFVLEFSFIFIYAIIKTMACTRHPAGVPIWYDSGINLTFSVHLLPCLQY